MLRSLAVPGGYRFVADEKKHSDNRILTAFHECRDGLVRNLLKMCVRAEDVDDILQTTVLKALESNRSRQVVSPKSYLFVISRNLVFKSMSSRSQEIRAEVDDAIADTEAPDADERLYYRQKLRDFDEALRSLPARPRQAIVLRKFFGLAYKDIARKMGVSVSSVEKYVAQGTLRCRDVLRAKGYYPDDAPDAATVGREAARNRSASDT